LNISRNVLKRFKGNKLHVDYNLLSSKLSLTPF